MELSKNKKLEIVLAGSVTTQSGYGSHSRDIARALIKSDKYDVKIVPIRWGSTPQDALNPANADDKMILDRIVSGNLSRQPDIYIHITIPNEFQAVGKLNIGITAGIETTACKAEWIDGCNRMDLVLATSQHSADVFKTMRFQKKNKQTGQIVGDLHLTTPVQVLFEGVNTDVYKKKVVASHPIVQQLNDVKEDFCFLFVGHWLQGELGHDRKDIGMMIKTFIETFKKKTPRKRPALVLKTSQAGFSILEYESIFKRINEIRNICRGDGWTGDLPNIYVLTGSLTDDEMNSLYNHKKIKSLVSFTKGEGFGRPLLEFTTTGKPVIASAWSGQLDFLDPKYCVLLPGQLTDVHPSATNQWIVEESKWFTVNYAIASQRMADVHKNYKTYLEQSAIYRKIATKKFSFAAMVDKLCDYIDNAETYSKESVELINIGGNSPTQNQIKLPKLKISDGAKKISLPKLTKV